MVTETTTGDSPRVSVITPFFNREHCLAKALESVVQQSFQDWEMVLTDDGSTDSSRAIVERYAARYPGRIRLLTQRNQGSSAARNRAIKEARGTLIAILDSDDEWHPQFLQVTTDAFLSCPQADWIYVNACRRDKTGKIIVPSVFDDASSGDFRRLATERHGELNLIVDEDLLLTAIRSTIKVGANSIVRRRVFEKVLYPEGITVGDDRVLTAKSIAAGFRYGYIDQVLLNVYQYGDNVSAGRTDQRKLIAMNRELIKAYQRIGAEVPLDPRSMSALRAQLSGLYYSTAVHCVESRESYIEPLKLLLQSFLLSPRHHPAYRSLSKRLWGR
jgi:glycosyltransferase involved in cell wall biosynthesis